MNLSDIKGGGGGANYTTLSVDVSANSSIDVEMGFIYDLNVTNTDLIVTLNAPDPFVQCKSIFINNSEYDVYIKSSLNYFLLKGQTLIKYWGNDSANIKGLQTKETNNWNDFFNYNETKIQAGNKAKDDEFGKSCSMSADGETCIVTSEKYDDETGAAYVFTKSGSGWTEQQMIQASDKDDGDSFGGSCSISGDGNTCIVGAYEEDTGGSRAGAVYVFTRTGSTWNQQQKLMAGNSSSSDHFGISCSISDDGNTCIVGAPNEDTGASNAGAAYIFTRVGSVWTQKQILLASDKAKDDYFGKYCSISGDGNTCVVSSPGNDPAGANAGSAYIFTRTGSTWSEQQMLLASDKATGDYFGTSCSISGDGNTCVVGAYQEDPYEIPNAGSAYIFGRAGSVWTEQQKITASDKESGDLFSRSCSMSNDGNVCLLGAEAEESGGYRAGAAYIFTRVGSFWNEQEKLMASDKEARDYFGIACSISSDGNTCLVTANEESTGGDDTGAAYIFEV